MQDMSGVDIAAIDAACAVCREMFARRGYSRVDTPLLEETELFLRKSGGELASRLFSFTEPGGFPVAIRPEYTAPVLRHVIESGALTARPLRLQYSGPVLRHTTHAPGSSAGPRQFTQLGAEMIGASGPRADGEVLSMAWQGLKGLGVPKPRAVIGHVGLIWDILRPFELSERARLFLVGSTGQLKAGAAGVAAVRKGAADLGFLRDRGGDTPQVGVEGENSLALVESVLGETLGEAVANSTGARTAGEIVARLARKLTTADDPARFEAALGLLADLARIEGPADAALASAAKLLRSAGQGVKPLDAVRAVMSAATDEAVPGGAITLDLGLARGIAYYTGMVFDLTAGERDGVSLGGGGRYDGLPRALGADQDVPALGFAYNLDTVLAVLPQRRPPVRAVVLVAPADERAGRAAAAHAALIRERGDIAVLEVDARSKPERLRSARAARAAKLVTVTASGQVTEEAV